MTKKQVQQIEELIKDIDDTDSELWSVDYGCDGVSDECCGNCGGNDFESSRAIERLKAIINKK